MCPLWARRKNQHWQYKPAQASVNMTLQPIIAISPSWLIAVIGLLPDPMGA
jgi:hypothetical protein